MRVSRVLGMALVTLRVTDTVKEALPVIPPPPAKTAFTYALGAALSLALGERDPLTVALEAAAVSGLASLLHDAQAAAQATTDAGIAGIIRQVPRRAQPLGV